MQLHKYREQLQSAKQLIEKDTHKEAIKDFRDATSKLHQLSAAEAAKTAVEKRYREADKLLPLCNILREKDILQNNIDILISQKESVSNDITASGEKLETLQKEILEYTIKSIWKEYIDLSDLKNLTENNLTNIEDKLVKTLIALLYEFSDAGIINLNEITLASDKIMKWADAFEHSEFKALVQQSGSLRAKLSDAEKRINEMLMQYPYLNEDRPSIDATINELKASIHDLTLESARLETEKASLEQTYRKINEDIDVAESKLKILTEQSCNVDEEAVWRAEREISALKEEYEVQKENGFNSTVIDGMTGFIFCNRFGNIHNPQTVNRTIKRILENYNAEEVVNAKKERRQPVIIPHFSCHHLRHTFCTRFCEKETNIKVIQAVMGHANIETTMDIYAEVTDAKKKEAIENLSHNLDIF